MQLESGVYTYTQMMPTSALKNTMPMVLEYYQHSISVLSARYFSTISMVQEAVEI